MKKALRVFSLVSLFALCSFTIGDTQKSVPSVDLKTLDGETFNTSQFENDGKPIFVSFWAQWCVNCVKELNAISEVYPDWIDETGVKIYAVSIDNTRNRDMVGPFAAQKGWEYEILLDSNKDFYQAMNVANPPYSFIIDGNGKIVWEHTGYHPGDEDIIKSVLDKLVE